MENCIENKHKKFNIFKSKVFAAITMLIVGIVMMLCFACNVPVSAATSTSIDETKVGLYDTDWSKSQIKVFVERGHSFFFNSIDITTHYLRITKDDGKTMIDDLTHLSASFEISNGGKKINIKVDREIMSEGKTLIPSNAFSKEGTLTRIDPDTNDNNFGKKFKNQNNKEVEYEECNYEWQWSWYVTKIVYLYVWYIDPDTGKQVAGSFMPNGEHPLYNKDGTLKGIYDVNNKLVENMTLNENGIPSEVIKNEDGTETLSPIIGWNSQVEGTTKEPKDLIKHIFSILTWPWGNRNNSNGNSIELPDWLYSIFSFVVLVIIVLIVAAIIKLISFIIDLFK